MDKFRRIDLEKFAEYLLTKIEVIGIREPTPEQAALFLVPLDVLLFGDFGSTPEREVFLLETPSAAAAKIATDYITKRLAEDARAGLGEADDLPEAS